MALFCLEIVKDREVTAKEAITNQIGICHGTTNNCDTESVTFMSTVAPALSDYAGSKAIRHYLGI